MNVFHNYKSKLFYFEMKFKKKKFKLYYKIKKRLIIIKINWPINYSYI